MSEPNRSLGMKSARPSLRPRDLMAEPRRHAWFASIITLFPEAFPGVLGLSLTGRALQEGRWALETIALRDFGLGKHKQVDDTPAGGGAGLVLKPDVLEKAIETARFSGDTRQIIAMSPRGRRFTQKRAAELAKTSGAIILCGRFEGFDERVLQKYQVEEISMGDFVMTGGEIAAQGLIDSTVRLIDGTVGNAESLTEESFSNGLLEHPQYTRPSDWQGLRIPDILLSGNHAEIAAWRRLQSEALTQKRRPDLWRAFMDTEEEAEQSDANEDLDK